ncbi:rhodanese-like domain-containing protein [Amphibiibacter pelophylacis]|uniref:Rhodanese-like domain-containing protein n=1 Tax=Amphibiibacter pelophylacis TaxID=1799477 RepID=A0ACC6NY49_9BURK
MRFRTMTTALATMLLATSALAQLAPVTTAQLRDRLQTGKALVIDVRESNELADGVIAGARLLPMSQLPQRTAEIPNDPDQPVYLVCRTQNRSQKVAQQLAQLGYKNVTYVQGGMSAWQAGGLPVVQPPKSP